MGADKTKALAVLGPGEGRELGLDAVVLGNVVHLVGRGEHVGAAV